VEEDAPPQLGLEVVTVVLDPIASDALGRILERGLRAGSDIILTRVAYNSCCPHYRTPVSPPAALL